MRAKMKRPAAGWALAALLVAVRAPAPAVASFEVVIQVADAANQGLNDPAPRDPVGGNQGTSLGEQRMIALRFAAEQWGEALSSPVPVVVEARFTRLSCTRNGATLGFAGPASSFADFEGAPRAMTLYPSALADRFAGMDVDPGEPDIVAQFNSQVDTGCFSSVAADGFYYGLDGQAPADQIDIIPIMLHELAHGLGFGTTVDTSTGERCCSDDAAMQFDDGFMLLLEDHDSGKLWPEMTDAERFASARNTTKLHWIGERVRAASAILTQGRTGDHVEMYAPKILAQASSVSHFSDAVTPDELLEPFAVDQPERVLATAALLDIGWGYAPTPSPTPTASPSPTATVLPTATAAATPLRGDGNCDGWLAVNDVTAVIYATRARTCGGADSNRDGRVDELDVADVIARLFVDERS